ncbi:MAG: transposase [Nitrososphaerales archaeon]
MSQDESIFVQNIEVKKVWAAKGIRPIRIVSGSRDNTVVFGALSIHGRQYDWFDGKTFLRFLKKVHEKFRKLYLFLDKASQHHKTKSVLDYLARNRKTLRVRWIPTASPEFNVMEECWRQGEKDLARLPVFPTSIKDLKSILGEYYRTRRFSLHLDMRRFLLTTRCL